MFYETPTKEELRFGDVLRGYVIASPNIDSPFDHSPAPDYKIEILNPEFVVVLSPCCSIGDNTILLSPLQKIPKRYFDNPYLLQDMTNVNRVMMPEQSFSPEIWSKMQDNDRVQKQKEGLGYAFLEYFVYEEHPVFQMYSPSEREPAKYEQTRYYRIDFRNTYRVSCKTISKGNKDAIKFKVLQLSIPSRQELRDKIGKFYTRVPDEDNVIFAG